MPAAIDLANAWFAKRGWKPFAFQRRVWAAVERGQSGLLHASTGAGNNYRWPFNVVNSRLLFLIWKLCHTQL